MVRRNMNLLQSAIREVLLREFAPPTRDEEPADIEDTAADLVAGADAPTESSSQGANAAAYLDLIKGINLGLTSKSVTMGASGNSGAWEVDPDDLVGLFDLLADPDSPTTAAVEDQLKLVQALAYAAPIIQVTLGDARVAQVAASIESEIQKIKAAVVQGKDKLLEAKKKAAAQAQKKAKKGKAAAPPKPVEIEDDPFANENEAFTIDKEPAGFEEQILMERIMSRLLRRKILSESRYSATLDALSSLLKRASVDLSDDILRFYDKNVYSKFKRSVGSLYTAALEDDVGELPTSVGDSLSKIFDSRFIPEVKASVASMSDEIGSKIGTILDNIVEDFAKSIDGLDQAAFASQKGKIPAGKVIANTIGEVIEEAGVEISDIVAKRLRDLEGLTLRQSGEIISSINLLSDDLLRDSIEAGLKAEGTVGDDALRALNKTRALYSLSAVVKQLSVDAGDTLAKASADLSSPETFVAIRNSISTTGQKALRAAGEAAESAVESGKKVNWKDVLGAVWDPVGKAFPSSKVIWAPPGTGGFRKLLNAIFVLPVRASLWMLYAAVALGAINETGENAYDFFNWIFSDEGEKAIESMKNVFVVIELAPDAFKVLSEQFSAYEPQEGTVSGALGGLQALGGLTRSDWMEKLMTPVDVAKAAGLGAVQGITSFSTGVDIENAQELKKMSSQAATLCTSAAASYQALKDNVATGNYELAKNAVDVPVISASFKKLWEISAPAAFFGGPLGGG